jgi:hypothetical protein
MKCLLSRKAFNGLLKARDGLSNSGRGGASSMDDLFDSAGLAAASGHRTPDGFHRVHNNGDGNCEFLAFLQGRNRAATAINSTQLRLELFGFRHRTFSSADWRAFHDDLMAMDSAADVAAGHHVGYNKREHTEFLASDQSDDEKEDAARGYCDRMRLNKEEGGQLELRDLASMHRQPIHVWNPLREQRNGSFGGGNWDVYGEEQQGLPVYLIYTPDNGSSGHWECLRRDGTADQPDSNSSSDDGQTCSCCGKSWDGNAQCNCMCEGCETCLDLPFAESERDPRVILGVTADASTKAIKKAFHALAIKYHPDKNANCPVWVFQRILGAYDQLTGTEPCTAESGSDDDGSAAGDMPPFEDMFKGWKEEDFEDGELNGTAYEKNGNEAYSPGSDSDSSMSVTDEEDEAARDAAADREIAAHTAWHHPRDDRPDRRRAHGHPGLRAR